MTAHTAVVFTRYMMLSLESRESNDNRSLGELFLYFSDEMSDPQTWPELKNPVLKSNLALPGIWFIVGLSRSMLPPAEMAAAARNFR